MESGLTLVLMHLSSGGSRRGWGLGRQDHPIGGPSNLMKREKTLHALTRIQRILVVNSYLDSPLSEILYLPLLSGKHSACVLKQIHYNTIKQTFLSTNLKTVDEGHIDTSYH